MPVFQYKALDSAGKAIQGLKEADSPKALAELYPRALAALGAAQGRSA